MIDCSFFESNKVSTNHRDTLLTNGIVLWHSRGDSILPRRPCPTIWSSSSPALAKETYGSQRGDALLCGVKHALCSSKKPRIVTCSTPTFCIALRVQSFRVCQLFQYRVFISARYSTSKSSTSPSPSCRRLPSSPFSPLTYPSRDQRVFKNFGQTKSPLRFLHRHMRHHELGLGVATSPRDHEIECRLSGDTTKSC